MKKIFNILLIAAATLGLASSCADVPMPYNINSGEATFGKKLPYKNASLSSFTSYDLKGYSAWSMGSNYTQATGYQAWNGDSKSNVEVESYLISPALNTTCTSGKVRISFDQTIRYTNNVSGWAKNHKVYISKNYDGNSVNFEDATWSELEYVPVASPYSDWTLYTSGYINVPEEFVNHDSVYVAFYFYAPATASTTWELENFLIEEGEAINNNGQTPEVTPSTGELKGNGTLESPYNVNAILKYTKELPDDTNSDNVYFEGIICDAPNIDTGYGNATFHISDDGTENNQFYIFRTFDINGNKFTDKNKLKKGDKVVIYGPVVNYKGNTPETAASKTYLISINGKTEGTTPQEPTIDEPSEGLTIEGTTVTLANVGTTPSSESITIDLATLGYENAEDVTNITLSDGTSIIFDKGTNANAPKYYTATKGVRVYANNTITFEGKSKIANVVMTCDSYNGIDYVGNTTATISSNRNTLIYTNASSTAGTQLRVKTIKITYAN